jgi:hypothetical protein
MVSNPLGIYMSKISYYKTLMNSDHQESHTHIKCNSGGNICQTVNISTSSKRSKLVKELKIISMLEETRAGKNNYMEQRFAFL